ncbi:cation diffusion facilitator family transporter [Ruminiclostridium sufflavum DSM 19573]|uniref:Cation diffusion facilitator family transporter n=1 Tax=Ruminiclostridium sufflavum DSM 19573 TaxID=1121337 RepID=A0A318XKU4_9FIRM|nr:cation diffusion facilitator family transporter [Ruminiclostridium sufflavum]PYG86993.1 cation diffusion facilitator family transporter [Ruminiclostridium sufflavum DSM 19573]
MTSALIKIFIKDYKATDNPQVRENYGKFASILGIATNLLLFLIKIIAGTIFSSISIIADAVNNLSDSASSVVTLAGFKISGKPADEQHPFGHARMEYVSGLIVSFIIIFLGLQLIKSSIDKIIHPQLAEFSILTVVVLITAIMIKLWQCIFYRRIGKEINSMTILAASVDSRNDILATAAVLTAAIATRMTGFNLDGYMGFLVAILILASGIKLVSDTISPLLGTAPTRELVDGIYKKVLSYDNIIGIHDLTVHSYGAYKCFASVHCEVPAEQDIMVSHDIIDNIERDFLKEQGIHMVIHLDPVVTNDEKTNELNKQVRRIIEKISPELTMHDFRVVWGISHSNLIFDIVSSFNSKLSDGELIRIISEEISSIDKSYRSIITVDHNYVPCKEHK